MQRRQWMLAVAAAAIGAVVTMARPAVAGDADADYQLYISGIT